MSQRVRTFLVIASLLIGTLIASMGVSASSNPAVAGGDKGDLTVTKVVAQDEADAALAFWTHDRIAQAQPLAMPAQLGPALPDTSGVKAPEAVGAPGFAAGGAAAPDADAIARAAYPADWAALEKQPDVFGPQVEAPDGTSQVYTSFSINDVAVLQTLYPHKWVGRLSFTTAGGTSYCSATSISNNHIVTAAHCVYDTTNNVWYSNWVFTPAYRNGSAPYGTFAASSCTILTAWVNLSGSYSINSWAQHDVAVCNMRANSAGTTLNNAVGWAGRQWNWSYVRHFFDMGYPFRDYNDNLLTNAGLYLRACAAESFQQTTETRGMGCSYGRGISGGPWLIGYAPGVVSGAVDGVNSGLFIGTQNLYAARFNSNNIVPICNAAGC